MEVTAYKFIKTIADDFGISNQKKIISKFSKFPLKDGKRKINASYNSIIVDLEGKEHPYMLDQHTRNNEKLEVFDHIYLMVSKTMNDIIEETGIKIKSEKCRICEGGGWYSQGTKYYYKDITCEI